MAETDCEQTEILMKECFSVPWSVDALKEMFHTKGYCSFLAKEETEVIGYIGMKVVLDEADITNVAVLPADCCVLPALREVGRHRHLAVDDVAVLHHVAGCVECVPAAVLGTGLAAGRGKHVRVRCTGGWRAVNLKR